MIDVDRICPISVASMSIHVASFTASDIARYSASQVDSATLFCFLVVNATSDPFKKTMPPDLDLRESLSVAQSASAYATIVECSELDPWKDSPSDFVLLRYLRTLIAARQCLGPGFRWKARF